MMTMTVILIVLLLWLVSVMLVAAVISLRHPY